MSPNTQEGEAFCFLKVIFIPTQPQDGGFLLSVGVISKKPSLNGRSILETTPQCRY